MYRKQKEEKFISQFCKHMDDPIMEAVLRVAHLGESEDVLDKVIAEEKQKMEEMLKQFELTDATQTILTEEEKEALISQSNVKPDNGDNTSSSTPTPNQGHNNVSLEYATHDGVSS